MLCFFGFGVPLALAFWDLQLSLALQIPEALAFVASLGSSLQSLLSN